MNGSQQGLSLIQQNLQQTKNFRLGKKQQQQVAANENPEEYL